MDNNEFYTFYEYMRKDGNSLTASMEDYLEMIYRLSIDVGFTRVHELSEALNVQPPSVTRMVQKLAELKLLKYEKYGVIMLEDNGKQIAERLINRHKTIEEFFKILGTPESKILGETEMVEHAISSETVKCLEHYINFMKDNPEIYVKFQNYIKSNNFEVL